MNKANALEFVNGSFSRLWPTHLDGFTKLLINLRERFDGDLDLMLILAVIGARTRPDQWCPAPANYRSLTLRSGETKQQLPINTQSLADYSGIPRETVRRKVAVLLEKGWVERAEDGRLTITPEASKDLEKSTLDTMDYLAAFAVAFKTAIEDTEPPLPSRSKP